MFKLVHDTNISWYSFGYAVNVGFPCQALVYKHARNFVNFTRSSAVLSSITFSSSRAFVDVKWGVPNIIKFVLLGLIDSLLALNQLFTACNSSFTIFTLLFISLCEYKIMVSSANKIKSRIFDVYAISLTYNMKSSGPSMEPCGTPQMTFCGSEVQSLNATYCVLLER